MAGSRSSRSRRKPARADRRRSVSKEVDVRARLFDADREDRALESDELAKVRPTKRQLLWIDVTGDLPEQEATSLAERFGLRDRTRDALHDPEPGPLVALHGDYLHVRVAAEPDHRRPTESPWLDIVAPPNVVITRHDEPIDFLGEVDDRIERDAAGGSLTSPAFLAALLEAAITSYHAAVDRIEDEVDHLDTEALGGRARDEVLGELVGTRRRIARLRRLLTDHRGVFTTLGSPDTARLVEDPDAETTLRALAARYENALGAVEASREALLGSFDVFMSRTAHRTNEVMKALTIATVLLLPGSLLAGLLGMNVEVPLEKDDPASFWLVVLMIALLAGLIVLVARIRRWI